MATIAETEPFNSDDMQAQILALLKGTDEPATIIEIARSLDAPVPSHVAANVGALMAQGKVKETGKGKGKGKLARFQATGK